MANFITRLFGAKDEPKAPKVAVSASEFYKKKYNGVPEVSITNTDGWEAKARIYSREGVAKLLESENFRGDSRADVRNAARAWIQERMAVQYAPSE